MAKFNVGDEVLVDRNIVAEIQFYDEDLNIVRYVVRSGGAVNTVTAPIRGGGAPDIVPMPQAYDDAYQAAGNPSADGAASEVTTVTHPQVGANPVPAAPVNGGSDAFARLEAAKARTPQPEADPELEALKAQAEAAQDG